MRLVRGDKSQKNVTIEVQAGGGERNRGAERKRFFAGTDTTLGSLTTWTRRALNTTDASIGNVRGWIPGGVCWNSQVLFGSVSRRA